MATAAKLGEEITVGTTPVEYEIDLATAKLTTPNPTLTIVVTGGNTGTIKFAVGQTPPVAQKAWAAATTDVTFSLHGVENGVDNLWAVGSLAGQKFTIV